MAITFTMTSSDGTYTLSNPKSMSVSFNIENNNVKANTQGFLRKVQIGKQRVTASVTLVDTKANIEANLIPQLVYPDDVSVTFDRNIVTKSTATATFVIENIRYLQELGYNGADQEVEINLTEVIAP